MTSYFSFFNCLSLNFGPFDVLVNLIGFGENCLRMKPYLFIGFLFMLRLLTIQVSSLSLLCDIIYVLGTVGCMKLVGTVIFGLSVCA